MSKLDYTPWALAREVGVSEPDNLESPGSEFLLSIQSYVNDIDMDEIDEDEDPYSIADSCTPVYTYQAWQTFVDLGAWDWDDEIGDTGEDMTATCTSYLFQIARSLAYQLIRERIDGDPEVEDDEEDEDDDD